MTPGAGPARVLFVNSQTDAGGAEISLLTALKHVDRARVDPAVVTLGFGSGEYPALLDGAGIESHRLRAGGVRNPLAWALTVRRLARLRAEGRFRAVVANGYHSHFYAGPAARLARAGLALFCRDFPVRSGRFPLVARQAFFWGAEEKIGGGKRVLLVPNGVETDHFRFDPGAGEAVRAELGLGGEDLVVAVAGRLQPWKGQHVFLEAAARVAAQEPRARFLVVGGATCCPDAGYPRLLGERAAALGIADRVVFTGHRRDMPAVYSASDVVVHCSVEPEPFGRVVAEAMAAGRAVVATRSGGVADVYEDGVSALGHRAGDVDDLANAILLLTGDAGLRADLGR
ncbi:MAG: glycosyltransferase, partial [Planctomycetota bacterium]